jgi:acyl carrier protein
MLNLTDVQQVVEREVRELLEEAFLEPGKLRADDNLVALGLDSLLLARLIVQLDLALNRDPFAAEQAQSGEMHTIGDAVRIYSAAT